MERMTSAIFPPHTVTCQRCLIVTRSRAVSHANRMPKPSRRQESITPSSPFLTRNIRQNLRLSVFSFSVSITAITTISADAPHPSPPKYDPKVPDEAFARLYGGVDARLRPRFSFHFPCIAGVASSRLRTPIATILGKGAGLRVLGRPRVERRGARDRRQCNQEARRRRHGSRRGYRSINLGSHRPPSPFQGCTQGEPKKLSAH